MESVTHPAAFNTSIAPDSVRPSFGSVSWGAVLAGSFVAAALALILLILGTGLGLTAVSPWSNDGATPKTMGIAAIAWLVLIHLSSSALGGYMAGRLRARWSDVHTDEVYFRDTAHGLVAWAVGIVLSAALLSSAATTIIGGTAKAGAAVAGSAAAGVAAGAGAMTGVGTDASSSLVDALFRSDRPREGDDAAVREEVGRILVNGLREEGLSAEDRNYLTSVVSARTGLAQPEVEKRLNEAMAQAKAMETEARAAADEARKALVHLSIWTFFALLVGAFAASYAATIGGRQRDAAAVRIS